MSDKPVVDTNLWKAGESQDFWQRIQEFSEGPDEEARMEITPKEARLLLYAAGP